jgi:hypothetical protein
MKTLILDSSTLITLSLTGLIDVLEHLKKDCDCRFMITPNVKNEVIDTPLKIRRFELEALNMLRLIKEGIVEVYSDPRLNEETEHVLDLTNSLLNADGENIRIIHGGEASCIALGRLLKNETIIAVDERTTRMLCESPENLQRLMELKLHTKVTLNTNALEKLETYTRTPIIRSSEMLIVAYKNNLISLPADKETALDALLFATKFKGNSISFKEIDAAKLTRI